MTASNERLQVLEPARALRLRVYDQLESLIVSGSMRPGERLVEGDLAARLGVSRGPIREALQLLARDGWVELQAHHGAFVHTPTVKEVDDFYDLRRALEMESARAAALRITPEAAGRLHAALEHGREVAAGGQQPLVADYEDRNRLTLHEEIAHISGNIELIKMLTLLTKRNIWYAGRIEITPDAWYEAHAGIVEAVSGGDTERAMSLMGQHIDGARADYQSQLKRLDREA